MSDSQNFQTEHEIIFHLLGADPEDFQASKLSDSRTDWEYIYRTADEHRIIPLVYAGLRSKYEDCVPAGVFDRFRTGYQHIARFNFARSTQMLRLIDRLEQGDVPVIAYKGMALAEFAYLDTALRQFGDIDLFIRRRDFVRAKAILIETGCRPLWDLSEKQERAVLRYYYEYPFLFGENDTLIELHWEFVEPFFNFDFEFAELWNRTVAVDILGRKIQTLAAEDYLIILCAHGSKHFWERLSWVCDAGKLIGNKPLDWDAVERRAARYGCRRMVLIGAYLARKITGAELPAEVSRMIDADKKVKAIADDLIKTLFKPEKESAGWTEMARRHLGMREKLSAKLKYSYRLLTTKAVDSLFLPMGRPR